MKFTRSVLDFECYRASMSEVERNTTDKLPHAVAHLKKCDELILSTLQGLGCTQSHMAAFHAHSLYLASCNLVLGGHLSAIFPLLRTAMESAIYGYLFNKEPGLSEAWLGRHDDDKGFENSKKSFATAVKRFRGHLQEHDAHSNGTPYEEYIMGYYDAAIDFGAHPNPIALTNGATVDVNDNYTIFKYDYLRIDYGSVIQGLTAAHEYGQVIAMINHFSHMCVNQKALGLDEVFMDFVKETNSIADKLNGTPIGFESRNYSRVNNLAKRPVNK